MNFNLRRGEVHVLIGENGAGKSTLMKILTGIHQKDEGRILLMDQEGELKEAELDSPVTALEKGISMVFQEFNLMENMTIAENICIGYEPVKGIVLDRKKMMQTAREQMRRVNMEDVSPTAVVETLTTAQKQCVEIAKCLSHDAKIIILDEPTSSLSEKEVVTLFSLIRSLKASGVSIVYISHRMEEIFEIGDRITVFRDGEMIDTVHVADTTENDLVKMIIGREFVSDDACEGERKHEEVRLEGRNISVGKFGKKLDFRIYKGEILGIFGLVGAGRTELARMIFGIDPMGDGVLYKDGKQIRIRNPGRIQVRRDRILCHVPRRQGIFPARLHHPADRPRDIIPAAVIDGNHKGHARIVLCLFFHAIQALNDIPVKARAVPDHLHPHIVIRRHLYQAL